MQRSSKFWTNKMPISTEQELRYAVLVHESPQSKIFTTSASITNQVEVKVLTLDHPSSKDLEELHNERSVAHLFKKFTLVANH